MIFTYTDELYESLNRAHKLDESLNEAKISDNEVMEIFRDANHSAKEFGLSDEFTLEYYIGQEVSAAGYPLNCLYRFLPDHIGTDDKEYQDAVRGWKENLGLDPDDTSHNGEYGRYTGDEDDVYEALYRAHRLDETAGIDRNAIKARVKELINEVDWSRWEGMLRISDASEPVLKKTRTLPNGLLVYVYLGWDWANKLGEKGYLEQIAKPKFEALRAVVAENEPDWFIKFSRSHGRRGMAEWTNYWAKITITDDNEDEAEIIITDDNENDF